MNRDASAPADLVTETEIGGHSTDMGPSRIEPANETEVGAGAWAPALGPPSELSLSAVYDAQFDFVWRCARRLGVEPASLDDVVQEVFLVVHRRLCEFEGRSTLKSWLFGITRRVVRDQRRSRRRKPTEVLAHDPIDPLARTPDAQLDLREQAALLHRLLDSLDDDKREAFVLSELEEMSGPEIADALQLNLNTVYARVRAARSAFDAALQRHQASGTRRTP
ncbi:MAG TPA: sigma-70 family RNA polymerase sigma factor [Polyangiales bacterium]|nr:sigma-70 family RNA polymerase sigma factor [Polyangiales bacterium]